MPDNHTNKIERPLLRMTKADSEVDRAIGNTIRLFDAYEQVAGFMEVGMRGLLWSLSHRGGRATLAEVSADQRLAKRFAAASKQLVRHAERLKTELARITELPDVLDTLNQERLDQLLQDALAGTAGPESLLNSVLSRHNRTQKQKDKGVWIDDDGRHLTLRSGFGDQSEDPPSHDGRLLHPCRIVNAYSFLRDLGQVRFQEASDAEEG